MIAVASPHNLIFLRLLCIRNETFTVLSLLHTKRLDLMKCPRSKWLLTGVSQATSIWAKLGSSVCWLQEYAPVQVVLKLTQALLQLSICDFAGRVIVLFQLPELCWLIREVRRLLTGPFITAEIWRANTTRTLYIFTCGSEQRHCWATTRTHTHKIASVAIINRYKSSACLLLVVNLWSLCR